jgi:hypothetical protein
MKFTKRTTNLILISIVVLIVALLAFYIWTAFFAPKTYQSGNRPEYVAFNYQMALIKEEYPQAFTYLSSTLKSFPSTLNIFVEELEAHGLLPELEMSPCIYVEEVEITDNNATVKLREQFSDPCTGIEVQNLSFNYIEMKLQLEKGMWRIVDSDTHFASCWIGSTECK